MKKTSPARLTPAQERVIALREQMVAIRACYVEAFDRVRRGEPGAEFDLEDCRATAQRLEYDLHFAEREV